MSEKNKKAQTTVSQDEKKADKVVKKQVKQDWDIRETEELSKQIADENFKRYVLSVVSGQEELVVKYLKERVKKEGLENDVVEYMIPMVNEYSFKKGQKVVKQKKLYPGYVFFRSRMNDKIWYVVRNTPGVRLIVGADTRPIPLSDNEFQRIVDQVEKSKERMNLAIPYQVGDVVEIKAGDFKGMQGKIRKIDSEKGTVIVNIEMLGRLTPVIVDVDKITLI